MIFKETTLFININVAILFIMIENYYKTLGILILFKYIINISSLIFKLQSITNTYCL